MKRKLLLFVMSQNSGTYHVQRGLYLGYPCAIVENGHSPAKALIDIFGRQMLYLCGEFPPPALEVESYRDDAGNERDFEYDGEPVIAVYYTPANVVNFFHNSADRTSLEPDIFVKYFENPLAFKAPLSASVA